MPGPFLIQVLIILSHEKNSSAIDPETSPMMGEDLPRRSEFVGVAHGASL
jgi:hypothetical protein